jgi:hypothetical protein
MARRKTKMRNTRIESVKGLEKVMKQNAVTPEDEVNRQVRPKASKKQLTGIKVHPITGHEGPKVEYRYSSTLS